MDEVLKIENDIEKKWNHWQYKNTTFLILSLSLFFLFADTPIVKTTINFIGDFGYLGAFLTGALFVSIFTVAPASVVLFYLAENLNPFGVALAAGIGGVIGDLLIFKYLKDKVFEELKPLFLKGGGRSINRLFKTPHFAWAVPIIGSIIIASPLPDEFGIGMLGLSKIKIWDFVLLTFLLDTLGIFLVIILAKSF